MFPTPDLRRLTRVCLEAFESLLFPSECAICGAGDLTTPFCDDCRAELLDAAGSACVRCARSLGPYQSREGGCAACRKRSLGFDAALALGPYQGPIRNLCLHMKHAQGAWLARWMADLVMDARGEAIRAWAESAAGLAPVPLHWRRRWKRRYNQSEEIAARLARRLDLPLLRPLRRVKATPFLAGRGRVERAELMRGAFEARGQRFWNGRDLILVDDVLTTGATCGAAARVLKKGGARRVLAVVVGRAEGRS